MYTDELIKDEFSKAVQEIIREETPERAEKVLVKCFERINKYDSAFIAQTIARLNISKIQNHKNAEMWAEKAEDLLKGHFAIVDTVGQAYKHDLKHQQKSLRKTKSPNKLVYSLNDKLCGEILQLGKTAAQKFQIAEKLFEERFTSMENYRVDEENPDVYIGTGEIETNLEILKLFLDSEELEKPNSRDKFIKALIKSSRQEIPLILPVVSWRWDDEVLSVVDNLYVRTLECFTKVSQNMNYFNQETEKRRIENISRHMKTFEGYFGKHLTAQENDKLNPDQKLERTRSYLIIRLANKFTWACKNFSEKEMNDMYGRVMAIDSNSQDSNDKLCLVNVVMSSLYKFRTSSGILSKHPLNQLNQLVYDYCHQLVQSDMNAPEPYLFYMIMNWPIGETCTSTYDKALLLKCIEKLKNFKDQNKNVTTTKLFPIFFLSGKGSETGLMRLFPFRQQNTKALLNLKKKGNITKLTGDVTEDDFISYSLPSEEKIKIRPADFNLIKSKGILKVTFQLGFTFGGPLAYSIENAGKIEALEKIKAFQSKETLMST